MSRVKDLQERVARLEERVHDLEQSQRWGADWFEERYKDVQDLVEQYIEKHIYYTAVDNFDAYQKGRRLKVVVNDLQEILGDKNA